ncbi:MAG: NAD-dependent deacetylase [Epsilonproteobacteria bacterium]|nr:NAD-dependent deacetylase [Campylobacterota bacterium]
MAKFYILSGAGLSAPSGIPTYTDEGGIWDRYSVQRYATHQAWLERPQEVIEFFNQRRKELQKYKPNEAHYFFSKLPNSIHLTQNIDDLAQKAGDNPIHLHGKLTEVRCEECRKVWDIGYKDQPSSCPFCYGKKIRPNVILFGEVAPNYRYLYTIKAEVFIAVGTSGKVIDIADIAQYYPISILINPKREKRVTLFGEFENYIDEYFTHFLQEDVTQAIKKLPSFFR